MNRNADLKARFPNSSASFLRANCEAPPSLVERGHPHDPLEAAPVEEVYSGRFLVHVTSFRRRLLDEDNLCEKYHVDCCRYAGLLPSDAPDRTRIQVSQVKVKTKENERTEIRITQTP